jgi:integrase
MSLYRRKDSKEWWVSLKANGRRLRVSTETENKKLAEKIHAKMLVEIQEGKWFESRTKAIGLDEVFDRYLKEFSPNLSKSTHARNQQLIKNFKTFFGPILLADVSVSLVSSYKAGRLEIVGQSTVRKELAVLRRIFSIAIDEWELCKDNPVVRVIKSLKGDERRVRYLSPEERQRLDFTLPAWLRPIVIIALDTGLRRSNILSLTLEQVDFNRDLIVVPETKNGEPVSIPMTDRVRRVLHQHISARRVSSPYVFTDEEGRCYSVYKVSVAFKRACERAGIENLRFHDLRHDFASSLVQNNVPLYRVQALLGHKDSRMTQRYAHLAPQNLRDAISTLNSKERATGI